MHNYTDTLIGLTEDVNGDYFSDFTNLPDSERAIYGDKFVEAKNKYGYIDMPYFHRAMDKDLQANHMLNMFKTNGDFVHKGAYGNIVNSELARSHPRHPLVGTLKSL